MARRSREKDNYGVYHITQRSSGSVRLFEDEGDRQEFLAILNQTAEKNNFHLLGYCVSREDEYHLILDANGCDISKVMKEINIRFSLRKNCSGELFRDRFRSRLLTSGLEEGEKAAQLVIGEYLSCRDLKEALGELTLVAPDKTAETDAGEPIFRRGCRERIGSLAEAETLLGQKAKELERTIPELLKDKPLRNELIRHMKTCSTLSMKEIGQLFGGLSESTVSKLLKAGGQSKDCPD